MNNRRELASSRLSVEIVSVVYVSAAVGGFLGFGALAYFDYVSTDGVALTLGCSVLTATLTMVFWKGHGVPEKQPRVVDPVDAEKAEFETTPDANPDHVSVAFPTWWEKETSPQLAYLKGRSSTFGPPAAAASALRPESVVRLAQCPNCGDFRVDLHQGNERHFDFSCTACGHHWSWTSGQPWPATISRPGRSGPELWTR